MSSFSLDSITEDSYKFGENIARNQRLIAKLLYDWANFKDPLDTKENQSTSKREYMTTIYFDKMAILFCRWWDALHAAQMIRYSSAFLQRSGFHGRGSALKINRENDESFGVDFDDHRSHEWAYTTEIIEKLKPSLDDSRALFKIEGDTWKDKCKIYPGIVLAQWEAWISDQSVPDKAFLVTDELDYFYGISNIICALDASQIRALGTHDDLKGLIKDISFNLRHWNNAYANIIKALEGISANYDKESHKLVVTMYEIIRKCDTNRKVYIEARKKAIRECNSEVLKGILIKVQKDASEIWENKIVARMKNASNFLLNFSKYIRRGLYELGKVKNLKVNEIEESKNLPHILNHFKENIAFSLPSYADIPLQSITDWIHSLNAIRDLFPEMIIPSYDYVYYDSDIRDQYKLFDS